MVEVDGCKSKFGLQSGNIGGLANVGGLDELDG